VPTLVLDDGRPLGESDAILMYLGEGTPYVPEVSHHPSVCAWLGRVASHGRAGGRWP
jgi:hypothetical protein